MRVCVFEDEAVVNLEPVTLTRPAFDLLCGRSSLLVKQLRSFAPGEVGLLVRPALAELCRLRHPDWHVNDLDWLRAQPTVLINSRWLPPIGGAGPVASPCVTTCAGAVAFAALEREQLTYFSPNTTQDCLRTWQKTLPCFPAGGQLVRYLWDLVQWNAEQLCQEWPEHAQDRTTTIPPGVTVVGPADGLILHSSATIEPMVLADTTHGPVTIDRGAVVRAFTRLEGPCHVGPHTHVLGAKIRAGTTLGPHCRIGGEVDASIIHGYSNKYHDGFLGHSYIGEWVNLAAGTSNSDLRNDYDEVTVQLDGRRLATGLKKVGCFLGDHTKTGLGTLLNTGASAGIFCNLLPSGGLLPKHVPSFCSWWNGKLTDNVELAQLLTTAETVMQRRGCTLTEAQANLYCLLFNHTADERRHILHREQQHHLRRSA